MEKEGVKMVRATTKKRRRPDVKGMRRRVEHSYDHRGQTGRYGNIYLPDVDVTIWKPGAGEHEFCVIPFFVDCKENSRFRKNPDLNLPFTEEEIKDGETFDYKLSVLIHTNIGINSDTVLCLRTLNEACPICEERDRIDPDDEDALRALGISKKALYNVACFDSDQEFNKGTQIYEAPHASIEDTLSELARKPDRQTGKKQYKDYTIPEEKYNVFFERLGTGLSTEYKQVEIVDRRDQDEFTEQELTAAYEGAYNFEEIINARTYEELYKMLHGVEVGEEVPAGGTEERFRGRDRDRGDDRDRGADNGAVVDDGTAEDSEFECFGKSNNNIEACENCNSDRFDRCYAAQKEADKPPAGTGRGTTGRGGAGTGRGGSSTGRGGGRGGGRGRE